MTESTARAIRGHASGCFFNRITQTLSGYMQDTLRAMAKEGKVSLDEDGEPKIYAVRDAESFLGAAAIDLEVCMKPIGLLLNTPLRAVYSPGKERLDWFMHSAYITSTPGTWTPEDAASALTVEKLKYANEVFMGNAEPIRMPQGRGV